MSTSAGVKILGHISTGKNQSNKTMAYSVLGRDRPAGSFLRRPLFRAAAAPISCTQAAHTFCTALCTCRDGDPAGIGGRPRSRPRPRPPHAEPPRARPRPLCGRQSPASQLFAGPTQQHLKLPCPPADRLQRHGEADRPPDIHSRLEVCNMTILRYEPWSLVNRLHRHLDGAFSASAEAGDSDGAWWIPQVDVYEEPERFAVLVDVPGVEPKDIEITAEKGVLTVRGERRERAQEESTAYRRLERHSGKFLRRFTLPESANLESITAKHTQGVLEVTIPKQAKLQPRRIEVAAA